MLLTGIKDKNVVYDSLLAVTLSASEYDQVLAELGAWVAVPCWRWLTHGLAWINLYRNLRRATLTYLDHVPGVFLQICLWLLFVAVLSAILSLYRGLAWYERVAHSSTDYDIQIFYL